MLLDQLPGLFREQRPVRRRVDNHGLDQLAQQAAILVEIVHHHQDGVLQRGLADRHGP